MSEPILPPNGGFNNNPAAAGGVTPPAGSASPGESGSVTPPVNPASSVNSPGSLTPVNPVPIGSEQQDALDAHIADTANPHGVTAEQLGIIQGQNYWPSQPNAGRSWIVDSSAAYYLRDFPDNDGGEKLQSIYDGETIFGHLKEIYKYVEPGDVIIVREGDHSDLAFGSGETLAALPLPQNLTIYCAETAVLPSIDAYDGLIIHGGTVGDVKVMETGKYILNCNTGAIAGQIATPMVMQLVVRNSKMVEQTPSTGTRYLVNFASSLHHGSTIDIYDSSLRITNEGLSPSDVKVFNTRGCKVRLHGHCVIGVETANASAQVFNVGNPNNGAFPNELDIRGSIKVYGNITRVFSKQSGAPSIPVKIYGSLHSAIDYETVAVELASATILRQAETSSTDLTSTSFIHETASVSGIVPRADQRSSTWRNFVTEASNTLHGIVGFGQSNMSDLFCKSLYWGFQDEPMMFKGSSLSGTSIQAWSSNVVGGANPYYLSQIKEPLQGLIDKAVKLGKCQKKYTVILNQGEADCSGTNNAAAWGVRVTQIIDRLLVDFPNTPHKFIICKPQIDHTLANVGYVEANMNVIRTSADTVASNYSHVETFDLDLATYPRPDDGLHLRHESLRLLGQNLYSAITD